MDRRESLKIMFVGGVSSSLLLHGCVKNPEKIKEEIAATWETTYGRTPEETAYDEEVFASKYLTDHEYETVKAIADIILPKEEGSQSASEAGVPEFIRFIVKDMKHYQLPMRGGLKWLDRESNNRFNKRFKALSNAEQIEIVEDIAYPEDAKPEFQQGVSFFNLMRNLTLTGFFTSKKGIEELGYMGNQAHFWDGVPEDELAKHSLAYDKNYLDKYITAEERNEIMVWED